MIFIEKAVRSRSSRKAMSRSVLLLLLLVGAAVGCRTVAPLPKVNLAEGGWRMQQGQAVWKSSATAPEIAGELVLATKPDGSSFLQFTKTPLPFVVAQTSSNAWRIEFVPENRSFTGPGKPPRRLLWLQVARCVEGQSDPKHFDVTTLPSGNRRIEDRGTKESIEFYLLPAQSPQ